MPSGSICVFTNGRFSVFFMNIIFHCIYATFSLFTHRHLDLFAYLGYCKAAVNMGVQKSFWVTVFISFDWESTSGISESYSSYVFGSLENLCAVIPSDFTHLHSSQQCTRVFPFLYILTNIFYPLLFNNSHSEKCDISHCDFWLALPWLVMQRIFPVSVGHLYIFGHMYSDPQKINTKMAE